MIAAVAGSQAARGSLMLLARSSWRSHYYKHYYRQYKPFSSFCCIKTTTLAIFSKNVWWVSTQVASRRLDGFQMW
jgi:hypothetical protein